MVLSKCFDPSKKIIDVGDLNTKVGETIAEGIVGKFGVSRINLTKKEIWKYYYTSVQQKSVVQH